MERNRVATHIILPEARILVRMKTNPGQFAWATTVSEFEAALQAIGLAPKEMTEMRFFLAMHAFTVRFLQHNNKRVEYPESTSLYAFLNPTDGLVQPLLKTSPGLVQGCLL